MDAVPLPAAICFSTVCGRSPETTGPQALENHTPPPSVLDRNTTSDAQPLDVLGHGYVWVAPLVLVTWYVCPGKVKVNCITPPPSRPTFAPVMSYTLLLALNDAVVAGTPGTPFRVSSEMELLLTQYVCGLPSVVPSGLL